MIKAITVENFKGERIRMELSRPEETGLMVYEVTGIGAGLADINVSEIATSDGSKFNSARKPSRNITLSIKLMANPTVEAIRHKTYQYFPLKKAISLIFETDSGYRKIDGYTESNDPVIFSSQEYTQISIVCPNPNFYDPNYTEMVLSGYQSLFEFPFSNESLTENKIIFDDLKFDKRTSFVYEGEADTGVLIKIHAQSESTNITMTNVETKESMHINTNHFPSDLGNKILSGDDIEINTTQGSRSAYLIRNGVHYNIINALGRYANWFTLIAGVNTYEYTAETGENSLDVSFSYKNIYEGV